jgi:tight adherence protein C
MNAITMLSWAAPFAAIVLMVYGLSLTVAKHRAVRKRINQPGGGQPLSILRQEASSNLLKERLLAWLSSSGKWAMKNEGAVSKIRALLIQAGFRHSRAAAVYYGIKATLGLLLPVPFILFYVVGQRLTPGNLVGACLLGGVGFFLPLFCLERLVRRRQDRLDKALPDVIDLLIICIEAGLAPQAAINRVAEEIRDISPEFHTELQLTAGEMRAGISRDQALRNLAERTGVPSIRALGTLIIQSDKLGTSIAQALRVHADSSRVHRTLKAEEKAAKMPVKILVPLLFFIFPAMFIVILGPAAIQIMKNIFPTLGGH